MCQKLKLQPVTEQVASIKGGDVSSQVEELNKANPDYVIVHGFLVAPVPALDAGNLFRNRLELQFLTHEFAEFN